MNRNIINDNNSDFTMPHVFTELSNFSSLSFPEDDVSVLPARIRPIAVKSINGFVDLHIPTTNDKENSPPVSLSEELGEIADTYTENKNKVEDVNEHVLSH